ncbi:CLUMA_CG005945, isoform A [Clunio marinus]|uniref:CLUMA_CG005945, isoform A n=1 Tax=Clunio marinus TaxID=568069 RepID=A0A1J1HXT2_9DIPT|nr:CLUMA_CG005945, isoform A [Clunio marinus]
MYKKSNMTQLRIAIRMCVKFFIYGLINNQRHYLILRFFKDEQWSYHLTRHNIARKQQQLQLDFSMQLSINCSLALLSKTKILSFLEIQFIHLFNEADKNNSGNL